MSVSILVGLLSISSMVGGTLWILGVAMTRAYTVRSLRIAIESLTHALPEAQYRRHLPMLAALMHLVSRAPWWQRIILEDRIGRAEFYAYAIRNGAPAFAAIAFDEQMDHLEAMLRRAQLLPAPS